MYLTMENPYGLQLYRRLNEKLSVYILCFILCLGVSHDLGSPLRGHLTLALDWKQHTLYMEGPAARIVHPGDIQVFSGTESNTESEDFKEILLDEDKLIIGSKNAVYQLYLADKDLSLQRTIIWAPSEDELDRCERLGKRKEQCYNYIRVISKTSHNEILICGTRAYSPQCRTYRETENGYYLRGAFIGMGKCPFDHTQNSTAVYTAGALYSGTAADLASKDVLIYRQPMRTEQHDSQWLNEPDFVSSFAYGDKVYFFYRETAIEHLNCGKVVFSRVGRVCKSDNGGRLLLKNVWTSYFKARLNCSIPGDFPYYFNEIQSSSDLGRGNFHSTLTKDEQSDMIYAVFSTSRLGLSGSAICAFRMSDIMRTFEGSFKAQSNVHANWLPVKDADIPNPHPARECPDDSKNIPDNNLMFIKTHPLMEDSVPAFGGQPILVQSSFQYRLTVVSVDWQYRAVDGRRYDILYVGTDDGRVLKAVNKNRSDAVSTVVIEDLVVFTPGTAVRGVRVYRSKGGATVEHLVVVSGTEVRTMALHRCHLQHTCQQCVALQDPYCSWDVGRGRCINLLKPDDMDTRFFYQSIETGKHSQCESSSETTTPGPQKGPGLAPSPSSSNPECPSCPCNHGDHGTAGATPQPKPDVENRLTMPQRDDTTQTSNDMVPVQRGSVLESVGPPGSCQAGKIALAVIVPALAFGILGFVAGLYFSRRKQKTETQRNNSYEESNQKKAENTYSQDPSNKYVTSPPFPVHGSVKIFHNATKQCNIKQANGSIEAIVDSHKDRKVYV